MGEVDKNGIVHMLRTAQQHHVQLSLMADQKANYLIAGSLVVLSILAGYASSGVYSWTMGFIAAFLLAAACFAIISVMPRHHAATVQAKGNNLLFFGHFGQMELEDFIEQVEEAITSSEEIYRMMMTDIYSIGKVLYEKKYRYLSISYRLFLFGLLISPLVGFFEWVVF